MPEHSSTILEQPLCPHCQYDLTSIIESWTGQCPLTGTCSECGKQLEWAKIVSIKNQRIPWLYEHADHWWNIKPLLLTYFAVLNPSWFWKNIKPGHAAHPRRMCFALLIVPYIFVHILSLTFPFQTYAFDVHMSSVWGPATFDFQIESYLSGIFFPVWHTSFNPFTLTWGAIISSHVIIVFLTSICFTLVAFINIKSVFSLKNCVRNLKRVFIYSFFAVVFTWIVSPVPTMVLTWISSVYYLTTPYVVGQPNPRWLTASLDIVSRIDDFPEYFFLIWLLWHWAAVYTKYLQLQRWKFHYIIALLLSFFSCSFLLFRGVL